MGGQRKGGDERGGNGVGKREGRLQELRSRGKYSEPKALVTT